MILVQSISTRYPYTTLFRSFGIEDGVVVASPKADGDLAGDKARNPALQGLPEHDRLRIEPASLIEQATQSSTAVAVLDRKSTRLNSSHVKISYAVFCVKKKK